jgi:hypothetical protein
LIKCRCDDVTKYIIHHAINQSYIRRKSHGWGT